MKTIITLAIIGTLAITPSALFAQSANDEDIKSDVQALEKDNKALEKDQDALAKHRASKAAAKANDDNSQQAVDSLKIGADKTAIEEKKVEKSADEKILKHHKSKAKKED